LWKKRQRNFVVSPTLKKADRHFYKQLTGNERLRIPVELLNHGPEQRLERASRITKLPAALITSSSVHTAKKRIF